MADEVAQVDIKSKRRPSLRDELRQALGNRPRLIKALEGLLSDAVDTGNQSNDLATELTTRVAFDDLGGIPSVANLKNFSLRDQIHRAGFRVVRLTASATGGRCNNEYGIHTSGDSYSRTLTDNVDVDGVSQTARVVEFDCSPFPDCDEGRLIKVASPKRPDVCALCRVIETSDNLDGSTHVKAYELYGDNSRANVLPGDITGDSSMTCHDMQSSTNRHCQIALANGWLGGVLDVTNMGIGGSNTTTWQNADLRAYVESIVAAEGRFDLAIFDCGFPNDISNPQSGAAAILARLDDCTSWVEDNLARNCMLVLPPGARLGGDAHPVPTPALTPDFTVLQTSNHYLRRELANRHRTLIVHDAEDDFTRPAQYGLADTADITRGEPPLEFVGASDGIHLAPAGGIETALGEYEQIAPLVERYFAGPNMRPDYRYQNTVADDDGVKNPNFLEPWVGAIPTTSVSFLTYLVGEGIEGTTVGGSGFVGTDMSGVLSVIAKPEGRVAMRMDFTDSRDPSDPNPNPTLRLQVRNPNTAKIVDALNDPDARGVDLDFFGCLEIGGFNQDSIFRIRGSFVGVDASAKAWRIANLLSDDGINGMTDAQRSWCTGFTTELMRAGNGACRIPKTRTYTDGYFELEIQGTPIAGYPIGELWFELSELNFKAREALLT